jgi:hypothetical protein
MAQQQQDSCIKTLRKQTNQPVGWLVGDPLSLYNIDSFCTPLQSKDSLPHTFFKLPHDHHSFWLPFVLRGVLARWA